MSKQIQDAYIIAAQRTPVGKAPRGMFRHTRPDDMLAFAIREVLERCPGLDPRDIEDVIVGCAMPEAEQGLIVARVGALLAGLPESVPGITVNRFCASGLQAVAWAADRIRMGEADVMIGAGTESMSLVPMGGNKPAMNPVIFSGNENVGIAYGMGLTAEKVAERWKVSRDDQDAFAMESHRKAIAGTDSGEFADEILPYTIRTHYPSPDGQTVAVQSREVSVDEGPRRDTTPEALAKLRPVFAAKGSVTAGNSSQTSDGAAAVVLMSERMMNRLNLEPLARFVGYTAIGVPPEIMGIGPKEAIPRTLKLTGFHQDDMDWIELNEAFAAQSLAVIREVGLDMEKVNPLGGAIALGHPLGATGAIRTCTVVHGLRRRKLKYGMVTMCVGTGMGAGAVFEGL